MMGSLVVNDFTKHSKYLIYAPLQKGLAFNVTGAGHFYAKKKYLVKRDNLKNMYLILYTLSGCGNLLYRGRSFLLQPSYSVLLNGEEHHKYYSSQTSIENWEFKWVRFCSSHSNNYDNLINQKEAKRIYVEDASFEKKIDDIIHLLQGSKPIKDVCLSCILDEILTSLYIFSQQNLEISLDERYIDMMSCRHYILNNYDKPISIKDIAKRNYMTEAAFIRKFKKCFSITPYALLLKTRLTHAMLMLETTNLPIAEISFSVGFADLNNFSKQFRFLCNRSPSEYRNQFRSFMD